MTRKQAVESTASKVREYIDAHPSIKDSFTLGIVNHSALSRRIAAELGISSHSAVLAACRRYRVDKAKRFREEAVRRVLRRSRIETRTKVAAAVLQQSPQVILGLEKLLRDFLPRSSLYRVVQGSQGILLIVDDHLVEDLLEGLDKSSIIKVRRNLVEIAVTSPENIEDVPGIMAFLSSAIAAEGLNILHVMSCYTDTIFIFNQKDMMPAFNTLARCLK